MRPLGLHREMGRAISAALAEWHVTARLSVLLLYGAVADAVFLAVYSQIKP
jgi:hypothetical protein